MNAKGYFQSQYTPGLWLHKTRPIQFTLCVDDFGVKYTRKEDKQHLTSILTQHYEVKVKDKGKGYLGITLDWDYNKGQVHLSIPGYVSKALKRF